MARDAISRATASNGASSELEGNSAKKAKVAVTYANDMADGTARGMADDVAQENVEKATDLVTGVSEARTQVAKELEEQDHIVAALRKLLAGKTCLRSRGHRRPGFRYK